MPTPQFQPYVPGINETADGKIKGLMNSYVDMSQYMQWILSHLDEKNVIRAKSVVADWVYAGNVTTDQLIAGTAKIGTALIEDLEVGSNVTMGANATISWSQVTSQPTIPTLPSYITSTKITSTTIESPTITGGTVTGGTIQTASSGAKILMNTNGLTSYDSSNAKSGISIGNGTYGYGSLDFYQYGNKVGSFEYNTLGSLYLGGESDVILRPTGTWNFSNATVEGLDVVGGIYKFG